MIKAILAVENSFGMGKNGTLPWPTDKEDLKQFKEKTTGCAIIMGSKTWNDKFFPAPLKNRENFVISSKSFENFKGATVLSKNLKTFIPYLDNKSTTDTWIIGGRQIFEQLNNIIEEYHITIINRNYDCDVFFDKELLKDFEISEINHSEKSGNHYITYKRVTNE